MKPKKLNQSVDLISNECIALRMRLLNRVISKLYDDALRPLGLKGSQLTILVAAQKIGVVRPIELSERLHIDVSTLSRNVDRMKNRGWLEVVPADDARAQPFQLTHEGRDLLEQAIPLWGEAQKKAKAMLGDQAVEMFVDATKNVRHAGVPK